MIGQPSRPETSPESKNDTKTTPKRPGIDPPRVEPGAPEQPGRSRTQIRAAQRSGDQRLAVGRSEAALLEIQPAS